MLSVPRLSWVALVLMHAPRTDAINFATGGPREISVLGASCTVNNGIYRRVGWTKAGAPFFQHAESRNFLHWDPDCDGDGSRNERWVFDSNMPSVTASSDLDGDSACSYVGRINSKERSSPPLGRRTWTVYCSQYQGFRDDQISLTAVTYDVDEVQCANTCKDAGDGVCDDGGSGSEYSICDVGTDCHDCSLAASKKDTHYNIKEAQLLIRDWMVRMLLNTTTGAFLPTFNQHGHRQIQDTHDPGLTLQGQLATAAILLDQMTNSTNLMNLTTALMTFYSKLDPQVLNPSWVSEVQQTWLGQLILLRQRAKVLDASKYVFLLVDGLESFLMDGPGRGLFASDFRRMTVVTALQDVKDVMKDGLGLFSMTATAVEKMTPVVLKFVAPVAVGAGVSGGAAMTGSLAWVGAHSGVAAVGHISAMSAGPVALAMAPILGATYGTMVMLPNDAAGLAAKGFATVTAVAAPFGIYSALVAQGAAGPAMMHTLAIWGGGTVASGGLGVAGGVAAAGTAAAGAVILVAVGVYATVKIANALMAPEFIPMSNAEALEVAQEIMDARDQLASQNLHTAPSHLNLHPLIYPASAVLILIAIHLVTWRRQRAVRPSMM